MRAQTLSTLMQPERPRRAEPPRGKEAAARPPAPRRCTQRAAPKTLPVRPLSAATLLAFFLTGHPTTARAQADATQSIARVLAATTTAAPAAAPSRRARAKRLFFQGLSAFRRGDYLAALTHFAASYQIRPKAVVLYNIAMCNRALFRYRRSIEAFERYRRMAGARMSARRRALVARLLREMRAKLAHISIRGAGANALVKVDGETRGRTPLPGPVAVDPGTRLLEIQRPGFRPFAKRLLLTDGQRTVVQVHLQRITGRGFLVVTSPVPDARASVDGATPAPMPLSLQLPEGVHRILVTAPGHLPKTVQATVRPGALTRREVRLVPMRVIAPTEGPRRPRDRGQAADATASRPVPPAARPARAATRGSDVPTRRPTRAHRATPFYKRAWFWTIIGAVVLGGAAAGGYFLWVRLQPEEHYDEVHQLR